jgi:hypothetical protein
VLFTSGVALKIFLAGLLTAGACLAQNWVIGGGGDFRDYITALPDRLFSPASGGTRQGMLHQFTPMFSVGYSF